MESDMVDNYFENRYFIDSYEALNLIESFFHGELPSFILQEKFDHGVYFGIKYSKEEIEIYLSGGRGYFEHSFKIDGKEFPLRQFDKRVDHIRAVSKKNILFILDVIKRFLTDTTLESIE